MKDSSPRTSVFTGALIGGTTSLVAVAILYVANRIGHLPFAPFDVFESLTRWLPGALITAGIDLMVRLLTTLSLGPTATAAKSAERLLAVLTFVAGAALLGGVAAVVARRAGTLVAGLGAAAVGVAIIVASQVSLGRATLAGFGDTFFVLLAWGVALAWSMRGVAGVAGVARVGDDRRAARAERRRFLGRLAGGAVAASSALVALATLWRRGPASEPVGNARLTSGAGGRGSGESAGDSESAGDADADAGSAAGRLPPARGTRAELTPNDSFYRIDIDLEPPRVDAATWRLHVDGLVAGSLALTLAQLRELPAIRQIVTMECISNPLGGDLISTSRWTGARLRDVLQLAKPSDRARTIQMEAADGFYESLSLEQAQDPRVLLVYEMNGVPLPIEHGFPLRIYIPDRHGMKQPKWITRLRLTDADGRGYWVDRGWSRDAIVKTTSVIDTVGASMMLGAAKVLALGGIAFAGARGISKVEVQVDDGPWTEAKLIEPPLGSLCWVLWRHDWPYEPGRHSFRVRAYDGSGALQPTQERGPHPDGASGIHTVTMTV